MWLNPHIHRKFQGPKPSHTQKNFRQLRGAAAQRIEVRSVLKESRLNEKRTRSELEEVTAQSDLSTGGRRQLQTLANSI
jgi:hypothetical protein